jgi:hypothetical protein
LCLASTVVGIVESGQQLFNEAVLESHNEDDAADDGDAPGIAMAALFGLK